ncbi:MAG: peptide-methionine (S)-S-oxide reductase MsrA [Planctomycetes bacterium]|nr:peptide-methionine (S)-S-oxide reductase MsrA [Planctomycetota bacterium]
MAVPSTSVASDPESSEPEASETEPSQTSDVQEPMTSEQAPEGKHTEIATLGAGCFWCIEAVLEQYEGITDVTSGYMGGHVTDPTYKQVCTGTTGHAEVVQVTFDPTVITYGQVLQLFWKLHDPTTLNRQGNDFGPQYRSAIFYHSDAQRDEALRSKKAMDESGTFAHPIVTEITQATTFYSAEEYHQDYYRNNRSQGYCRFVIAPKLEKMGLDK